THSTPVYTPCINQPRTFNAVLSAFRRGKKPMAADLQGTWAAIGVGLAEKQFESDSAPPMLACAGVMRGASGVFESVLLVRGDTLQVDRIAVRRDPTVLTYDPRGALTLIVDETGPEDNLELACRLTPRGTLVC